jgi:hypothetical protein
MRIESWKYPAFKAADKKRGIVSYPPFIAVFHPEHNERYPGRVGF